MADALGSPAIVSLTHESDDAPELVRSLIERVGRLERDYGWLDHYTAQQTRQIAALEEDRAALQHELATLRARRRAQPPGAPLDQRGGRWMVALMAQLFVLARRGGQLEGELALRHAELRNASSQIRAYRDALRNSQHTALALSAFAFVVGATVGACLTHFI
jgi:hypothetical protein